MRKLNLLIGGCIAFVLTSCTSFEEPTIPNSPISPTSDTFISLEDALENAEPYFKSLDDGQTRSINRKVNSVELISKQQNTRSELPSYYVVNFDDNEGFAILAADTRLLPVLAFSDNGSLSLQDTIYNKELARYISLLPNPNDAPASLSGGLLPNPTTYTKVVSPLISPTVQLWSQGNPFNSYCPIDPNTNLRSIVGCAAIAVGTITSYYEHPSSLNGYTIDWTAIKSNSNNTNLFRYLADLGSKDFLNSKYSSESTSTSTSNIYSTFKKLGYTLSEANFTETLAQNQLISRNPIFLLGQADVGGHAWVIDGLYKVTTTELSQDMSGKNKTVITYYYHCEWGWGGKGNGYFAYSNGFGGSASYYEDSESYYNSPFFSRNSITYNFKINQ